MMCHVDDLSNEWKGWPQFFSLPFKFFLFNVAFYLILFMNDTSLESLLGHLLKFLWFAVMSYHKLGRLSHQRRIP